MLRWLLPLLLVCPACFDSDFFIDYSEAGPEDPSMDLGALDGGADVDPNLPPAGNLGPDCASGCSAVQLLGVSARLFGLAADGTGGAWAVVQGLEAVVDANGQRPVVAGSSHLLFLTSGGVLEHALPLPFQASSVAASGNTLFIAGSQLSEGHVFENRVEGSGHVVVAVKAQQVSWYASWPASNAVNPPLVADTGGAPLIVGGPGEAIITRVDTGEVLHTGTGPGLFVMQVEQSGALRWAHALGGADTSLPLLAGNAGGAVLVARGSDVQLWDGQALGQVDAMLNVDDQGGLRWVQPWPRDTLSFTDVDLDASGNVWFLGAVAQGIDPSPLPVRPPARTGGFAFLTRANPAGVFEWGQAERNGTQSLAPRALTGRTGRVGYLLGEALGPPGPYNFGGGMGPEKGMFVAAFDANGESRFLRQIGPALAQGWPGFAMADDANTLFVGGRLNPPVRWGELAVPRSDQPGLVILRIGL